MTSGMDLAQAEAPLQLRDLLIFGEGGDEGLSMKTAGWRRDITHAGQEVHV